MSCEPSCGGWLPAIPGDHGIDWQGRFRSIIDNLREVVFQTDAQGRWTFLNRAWEEITGFSVEESLGVAFLEYVHPDDREHNQEKFRPLIEREKEYCRHEVRYLTRDGGFRWIEVQARLTLDEAGGIAGTSGTLSDVTERRRVNDELREARERLEFVLSSNPAVTFASRPGKDGVSWETTFISENVRAILGYAPEAYTQNPGLWLTTVHPDDLREVYRAFSEQAATGHAVARYRCRCADGSYRWIRTDARTATGPDGRAVETFGCLVDETHTRKIEDSLRSHAAILEAVGLAAQRFLDAASWRKDVDEVLRSLGIAAQVSRVHIFENETAEGELSSALRHEWAAEGAPTLMDSPGIKSGPYRKAGVERWAEVLGRGETVHGRTRDLPACEQALLAPYGVRSLLLVPIFSGRDWWGFIGFDDCATEREWSAAEIDALKAAAGILGAAIRREQTESALRYSEALLRTMTDASPLGFYVVDNHSDRILYFNDRFCDIWGIHHLSSRLRSGELAHKDLIPHCMETVADVAAFAATCEPLQDAGNRSVVSDYISFRDGRTIRRYSTRICGADDTCFGRFYLFEDVTEQKRAESELEARVRERTADLVRLNERLRDEIGERKAAQREVAQREARFRTVIEDSSDLIFVVNSEDRIKYVSPTVKRFLGYEANELIGQFGRELLDPGDRERVMAQFQRSLSIPGSHKPIEIQARRKDGSVRLVEAVGNNQLANPAVQGFVVTFRDITERRRLEDQFRQAQKMDAVGRLAGGVAHDFNNLLTVICGYSELVLKRLPEEHPLWRNMGQIKRAGDRATALVQQLLAFSRKQVVQPTALDLNESLAELDSMLRRLIGEDIELTITPAPEPVCVHFDRTQFDQIIINLSVNARDAMPNGGALSIVTQPACTAEGCQSCDAAAGDFAAVVVRDTGTGMTEEIKAHIYEPFFTTKDVGKGTGLGLSMVYGAVQQAGGHICIETSPGEGTAFRICLPRAERPGLARDELRGTAPGGGGETILLVEDEELVRAMLSEALKDAGYNVLETWHGEHALEVARQYDSEIHLVLTDVIMPRMSGRDLAAQLAALRPHAKIIYMSGYPRQELTPGCRFLKKPLTPEELIREVRAVLDGS